MPNMPDMADVADAVNIREAAMLTGRSEAAIYHFIATSQLPARPTMSRGLAINPKDLEDLECDRHPWHRWYPRGKMWQQSQATLRRLGAEVRHLFVSVPQSHHEVPWYLFPPLFM